MQPRFLSRLRDPFREKHGHSRQGIPHQLSRSKLRPTCPVAEGSDQGIADELLDHQPLWFGIVAAVSLLASQGERRWL